MAAGGEFLFSIVEDDLQHDGIGYGDLDLVFRRTENEALKRHEAMRWLRKMVGVVEAKDLPAEPTEEEFTLALRSGIILCIVVNKIKPGAVPKVVESSCHSGTPLTAFQYFENVRNFLVAALELGLPTFEASDLEQGGNPSRVVMCVLALKSYGEWKGHGGNGIWKFSGNLKQAPSRINFLRKGSIPFTNNLSRDFSNNGASLNSLASDIDSEKLPNQRMRVREVMFDKQTEIPAITTSKELTVSQGSTTFTIHSLNESKEEAKYDPHEEIKAWILKQKHIFDCHQKNMQELKYCLNSTKVSMELMQKKFHEEFSNLSMYIHSLADAALSYNNVLEENRKLYNQVQDLKGSIRVYCRVKPLIGESKYLSTVNRIEEGSINICTPSGSGKGHRLFNFNKVFGPFATQEDVFSDTKPLIRSVLDGYNVCIFAYGQTGSGKTFTMIGPKDLTNQSQGVNYRSLRDLFLLSEQRKNTFQYEVSVQMIEIYNEQIRDLLVTDGFNKKLEIHNSSHTGSKIPDAKLISVSSTLDVINLMNFGESNRAFGATALNDHSSRSHSCLTVHVKGTELSCGATILHGCLHLIDLAGSERVKKSDATGKRLKEAQCINKSLSALGDVISSLAQKNPHVPYRNSKLTQLLQSSLGGQAKTLMFVHISPEPDSLEETISTLKFAERVGRVELGAAKVNKDTHVKELDEQIASLKAQTLGETTQIQHTSGNAEVQNAFLSRQSSDLEESLVSEQKLMENNTDKESASSEWVDKVMVNKLEDAHKFQIPISDFPEIHSPNNFPRSSQPCTDESYNTFEDLREFKHVKPNGNNEQSAQKPVAKTHQYSKAGTSASTRRPNAVMRGKGKQKSVNRK